MTKGTIRCCVKGGGLALALLLALPVEAYDTPFSLMFMDHELERHLPRVEGRLHKAIPHGLYLQGIIYQAPRDWVVWINGERLDATTSHPTLQLQKVTRSAVDLEWSWQGEIHKIHLDINHTYDPTTGKTHCGDCRLNTFS